MHTTKIAVFEGGMLIRMFDAAEYVVCKDIQDALKVSQVTDILLLR